MIATTGFPSNEIGHRHSSGNDRCGCGRDAAGQGGSRGALVGHIQPSSMPESNMSTLDGCAVFAKVV